MINSDYWSVVWNILLCSIIYGNFIIPTDFHIFQRGRSTTNRIVPSGAITHGWEIPEVAMVGVFSTAKC